MRIHFYARATSGGLVQYGIIIPTRCWLTSASIQMTSLVGFTTGSFWGRTMLLSGEPPAGLTQNTVAIDDQFLARWQTDILVGTANENIVIQCNEQSPIEHMMEKQSKLWITIESATGSDTISDVIVRALPMT